VPCVVFSYGRKRNPGQVYVTTDDAEIASTIATDFVRRGFRNFAFFGLRDAPWALNRGRHFEAALQSQGMKTELFFADAPEVTDRKGQASDRALTQWLRELPKPVALMACNDDMALRLLHLCVAAGVRVPEDCAVVGQHEGPFTFAFSMRSQSSGQAEIFWLTSTVKSYGAGNSKKFNVSHDGKWHDYSIDLPANGLLENLRFDPSRGPGKIYLKDLRLLDASGQTVHTWN
jgi:hypothetical protein